MEHRPVSGYPVGDREGELRPAAGVTSRRWCGDLDFRTPPVVAPGHPGGRARTDGLGATGRSVLLSAQPWTTLAAVCRPGARGAPDGGWLVPRDRRRGGGAARRGRGTGGSAPCRWSLRVRSLDFVRPVGDEAVVGDADEVKPAVDALGVALGGQDQADSSGREKATWFMVHHGPEPTTPYTGVGTFHCSSRT